MTLRHGDRSQAVRDLQRKLIDRGAKISADGVYGDATEAAVRTYQHRAGLVADGIAGPKTLASLQGADCAHLLKNSDMVRAADRLGVPLAAVYALNEVESKGRGFLDNGKPVILYERHIMYVRLQKIRRLCDDQDELERLTDQLQQRADELAKQFPALVNPKFGGYVGGTAEHQRLAQARLIDDQAALESCSWGAFQVMGFNWESLGYASVQAFVEAMSRSESDQLEAFVRYIEADPTLLKALKSLKWAKVAELYNGPDYKRNLYDVKLQRAFERHQDCGCGQEAA
ncbi:peptidoglycan-binding protein [Pseudomonas plecoglossicida]|uniref:N-acetylmuramidase domain-containing protein n=1 Tax=Pseudomonas TaxID=286 RepID=UPI0002A1739C|nr:MULTISPECIES: N-acetylmuramidase family protein [Pseudomonas]AGA74244.1 putative peptidoglycan binding domain-containing protein [Pseudomonas putida HB3267]MCE0942017.1 N-acetylmuramidase family protein [Pseudomonas asiatica]MCE0953117.1 N-acetylmuramidase family protein [Pseudomonas asiatica]MCE1062450.1 N-acetylmuramidase family protein [Pseudomonas asiatica]MCE1097771.1 N-acetylmuramidase family protein [Pseudomonas asiatica]